MITVGFLGCAHVHAESYLAGLDDQSLDAEAVAVFDHDFERARSFASHGNLTVAASAEQLCRTADAAIITSEHVRYPELVAAAAGTGTPVLCEKPLGVSLEAAAAILRSGAWVSVAFPVRYARPVAEAKAVIDRGELGRVLAMSGVNHAAFPGRFFGTRAASGGGAIIDHVVHLADAFRWLTGCEFASVYAEAGSLRHVGDVEDAAQVIARTRDGAWVSIDPSWSRPAGMAGANDFVMTLWFEHGQLTVDAFARHGTVVREGGQASHEPYGVGMNSVLLADWLQAIRTGAPPPISMEDGWKATEVALAALASSGTGKVVELGGSGRQAPRHGPRGPARSATHGVAGQEHGADNDHRRLRAVEEGGGK
jgi:myo-inositol 2-dehydrogenase / D-chiro-inositol 1-dehydrogenase